MSHIYELQAAIGRYREYLTPSPYPLRDDHPYNYDPRHPLDFNPRQIRDDRQLLADEYAKLVDTTPITEEWAAKLRSNLVKLLPHKILKKGIWRIRIWGPYHGETGTGMNVKTRGEVRCLLLAAGIECDV